MDNTAIKLVSETISDAVMKGRYTVGHVTKDGQEHDIVPEGLVYVSGANDLDEAFEFVNKEFKGWNLRLNEHHILMIGELDKNDVSSVHNRRAY